MNPSLTLLKKRDANGRRVWRLNEDTSWHIGPGCTITVKRGYETNFATVPRVAYRIVAPTDLGDAPLYHDFMVREQVTDRPVRFGYGYSRWFADAVFYERMIEQGVPFWRRALVWFAVRLWSVFGATK